MTLLCSFELFSNGKLIAEFREIPSLFFDDVHFTGGMVLFNSLDLNHPCPALLSGYAITKDLSEVEVTLLTSSFEEFNKGLGR